MEKKSPDKPADLTIRILEQIRDQATATNVRLDALTTRVDTTNDRLERLERRQAEDSMRLGSELVALAKTVGEVRDLMRDRRAERTILGDHEKRIRALERKSA
jgi:hypothetical protein